MRSDHNDTSDTAIALRDMAAAEDAVVSAAESASAAFRALSAADSAGAAPFDPHAEAFLKQLGEAQRLIRAQIARLAPDRPFESGSTHALIEADLAVQRTQHTRRALAGLREALLSGAKDGNGHVPKKEEQEDTGAGAQVKGNGAEASQADMEMEMST